VIGAGGAGRDLGRAMLFLAVRVNAPGTTEKTFTPSIFGTNVETTHTSRPQMDLNLALAVPLVILGLFLVAFYGAGILSAGLAGGPTWWYGLLSLGATAGAAYAIYRGRWIPKIAAGVLLVALMFLPSNLAPFLGILGAYTILVPVRRSARSTEAASA
jgi:hypothetical protein